LSIVNKYDNIGFEIVNLLKKTMKKKIHPKYNSEVEVKCACGNTFKVGSTSETVNIEICSDCHPFYTGKEKLVDSTGRVDRFKQRLQKTSAIKDAKTKTKKTKKTSKTDKDSKKSDKKTAEKKSDKK
jgi:large subunit ribosomal protein L31